MKEHCLDAPGTQVVHLILHKRNQRRNHNSKAAKDKPRHLKRNGFSASGRHKAKGVVAVKHRPHNLLLKRAERPESPMTAQDFLCPFHLFSESLMSRIINCTESGFPARPGLLYGVTDVYGLMRVYMLEIRSHIERNCVYHTARAVVLKFKLNMLQILSHEFARTEIKDIPCYEYRLLVARTVGIELLRKAISSGVMSANSISASISICGESWLGCICSATYCSKRLLNSGMFSSFRVRPTA